MVNLILLGDEVGATKALADSVGAATAVCLREAVGEEPKAAWEGRGEEPPLRDEEETLLADRVELCSRILRQASAVSAVRDTLMPPFRDAVQLLAERGNPITQVKMMGVSLNLPEIDRIETARKPLQSPIQWVRNQALILLASTSTGETAVGSDLATEMGYDLANGLFLSRYKAYRRAVRKAGDPGHRRTLFAGSLCFALNVLLLCALATGIYSGARSLRTVTVDLRTINESITHSVDSWPWQRQRPPQPTSADTEAASPAPNQTYSLSGYDILSRRDFMKATALLALLAAAVTLTLKPSALWAALPGTSAVIAVLGPVALSPWIASAELGRAFFILTWYFWFPAPFFISLIAAAIHCSSVSLFFATTLRLRHSRHPLGSFLASGWQNCGFGRLFSRRCLYPLLLSILLPFALPILLLVILTLDYLLDLPFSLPTNALLIVGVPFLIALLHPVFQLFRAIPKGQTLRTAGKGLAILLGIVAATGLFLWLLVPVARWLEGLPPERVARFFVFLIVLTLLIAFTPVYLGLWRALTRPFRMSQAWLLRHRSITKATWEAQFLNTDPHQQHLLLSQTDYQTLSLTRLEFLEVLREIRPLINKEPALSTYWDQRDRLEKSLRQERQG